MAAISGDYPAPVQVNGFSCKNCTDVDYAKQHIDPAHPKSGPYGIDAATDPSRQMTAGMAAPDAAKAVPAASAGTQLDLTV